MNISSAVGDDLVVISNETKSISEHFQMLETFGFKLSRADTIISSRFIYYCERFLRIPQSHHDLLMVRMKRG